ncbi:hypothetical protein H7R52_17700 [Weissella confusa]|uniref:Uncharacterized protein n=1 Tax=Weissella confusa TaxID=1583 RepID=A0A923SP44_WEICO|nr:hypothetical protein [Weissella confusa]
MAFAQAVKASIQLPLLIDDAFVDFDRERRQAMIDMLQEMAGNQAAITADLKAYFVNRLANEWVAKTLDAAIGDRFPQLIHYAGDLLQRLTQGNYTQISQTKTLIKVTRHLGDADLNALATASETVDDTDPSAVTLRLQEEVNEVQQTLARLEAQQQRLMTDTSIETQQQQIADQTRQKLAELRANNRTVDQQVVQKAKLQQRLNELLQVLGVTSVGELLQQRELATRTQAMIQEADLLREQSTDLPAEYGDMTPEMVLNAQPDVRLGHQMAQQLADLMAAQQAMMPQHKVLEEKLAWLGYQLSESD